MKTKVTTLLRDSAAVRWTALLLIALTMFAAYVGSDVFSPLKTLLEKNNLWNSTEYGWFSSSYSIFNVFLGMLIFGGLILDRKGIRFTGILSCILMVGGIALKYWAMTTPSLLETSMNFLGDQIKMQVFWAVVGFGIFGVGAEVAGITVSKAIVKWFSGKELALAMGLQLSLARLGSAASLAFSPMIANHFGNVSASVLVVLIILILGSVCFLIYSFYDKKLDNQIKAEETAPEESFNIKDVKAIITNPGFWLIALLCVLFYSAVFSFLKYASDLMVNKFSVDPKVAGFIPSMLPFGCIILTPLFGRIYDKIGHGADLMISGAVIITLVHCLFAAPFVTKWYIAVILMVFLGIGFAMVPAAMWPSLAKIMPERQFGTTMALTFFIQNIGLWGMPLLIGKVLNNYCIVPQYKQIQDAIIAKGLGVEATAQELERATAGIAHYDYTLPMLIFVGICGSSIIIAFCIKLLDKKKHYGLQVPNMKKND